MRTISPVGIIAFAMLSTTSILMASDQTYEFQWNTSASGFSPTYLFVTAALDTPTPASTAIVNFEVTTPSGVWTPPTFIPATGSPPFTGTPAWADGDVEVTGGGSTLLFTSPADLQASGLEPLFIGPIIPPGTYDVQLGTTFVTDTTFTSDVPTVAATSIGTWSLVVPETTHTGMLLAMALAGLGLIHRREPTAMLAAAFPRRK